MTIRRFHLVAAAAVAAVAPLALSGVAEARWTGSDYCAVQNTKGDWALVGGASCNDNPAQSPNADWSQALILDFDAFTITDAYTSNVVEDYDSLHDMLTDLSANHASDGWMYVANAKGGTGEYVYLMVNEASCAGNSEWAEAPVCEGESSVSANASAHAATPSAGATAKRPSAATVHGGAAHRSTHARMFRF